LKKTATVEKNIREILVERGRKTKNTKKQCNSFFCHHSSKIEHKMFAIKSNECQKQVVQFTI
jgi:hypothetical protein